MRLWKWGLALLAAPLVLVCSPALAQEAVGPEVEGVRQQLMQLNASLRQIVELLEGHREDQRLGVVVARLQLTNSRLVQLESELRSAVGNRSSLEDEQLRVRGQLEMFADMLEQVGDQELGMTRVEAERTVGGIELRLELIDNRLQTLDNEIVLLENELAQGRDEMDRWQDYLDRKLSGD